MEKIPGQPSEVTISSELEAHLTEKQRAEYVALKKHLRDVLLPTGIWSPEFDKYIDENLKYFGMIGKGVEYLGKLKRLRKTTGRKEDAEHSRRIVQESLEKTGGWSPVFEAWLESGSADSLKEAGALMDYMSQTYIDADTNKTVEKWKQEDVKRKRPGKK